MLMRLKVSIPGSQELAPNWCRSATTLIIGPIALDPVHRLGEATGHAILPPYASPGELHESRLYDHQEKILTDKKSTLWATAYHEAGHAVAAMAYGKGIRRQGATIVPDPKRGAAGTVYMLKHIPGDPSVGGAYRGDSLTGRMRLRIEEDIIVSLAGLVAQRCFRPSSVRSHHGRSDHEAALDLLTYIVGDERELKAYWRLLRVRTENFVRSPPRWMQIEAIAKALMEKKTLGPGELRQLYADALGSPISLKKA
jgi:hypothetical protein